jgi:anti-anti-sigma regulatory factor
MKIATMAMRFRVEQERITPILQEAAQSVEKADADLILDFSSVRRLDASAIGALEKLTQTAETRGVTVRLSEVNVDVYKVLKLVKLTTKLEFLAKANDGAES